MVRRTHPTLAFFQMSLIKMGVEVRHFQCVGRTLRLLVQTLERASGVLKNGYRQ